MKSLNHFGSSTEVTNINEKCNSHSGKIIELRKALSMTQILHFAGSQI